MITIPFDLELAKKINNGERNGMIVTDGDNYRVEFVYHREESFPILGVIHTDHGIISDWFSNNGFGGKNYRLKLKVPEYTTFKDGDVLSNEQGDYLFILNTNGEYLTSFHASWKKGRGVVIPRKAHADCNNIEKYRLATEDERQAYRNLDPNLYDHGVVYHKKGAYVIGNRHTNTIEGFWGHLKRTLKGVHHWVSRKHLQRYVDSSAFRYNTKHLSECERFDVLLQNIGHRLRYSQLKNMAA